LALSIPLQRSRGNTPATPHDAELSGEQTMGAGLRYSMKPFA
jgi:hypothetical protein